MNLISSRVRGMQDILGQNGEKWQYVCDLMYNESQKCGFKFARTPVLEHTELFERSSGDSSDIVNKEMYTFNDKSGRSLTLRPEGTAGIMRAVLESGITNHIMPLKLMYNSSCYRYEKPQSGRYREFFQFGLEIFGTNSIMAEYQLINLAFNIINKLNISDVKLEINSIGCEDCRKKYIKKIKSYFNSNKDKLCNLCIERLDKNPLRILDCKNIKCGLVNNDAPNIQDNLCEKCSDDFNTIKKRLDLVNINYIVNNKMVRGLDYYTGLVFEFIKKIDDSPLTICAGGRYDGLSKQLGGNDLPAVGLGFGIERLIISMNDDLKYLSFPEIYIASFDNNSNFIAENICNELKKVDIYAEYDICNRSIKSQMKYADKINATYTMVIGTNEIEKRFALIRHMKTGQEFEISIGTNFVNEFLNLKNKNL